MSLLKSFKNLFSARKETTALYERGREKAEQEDWSGAIDDYTTAIDAAAPADIKAMAFFNRARAHVHLHDYDTAIDDLRSVLAISDAPEEITVAAREKLARWKKRGERMP